jgi:hypothetical protein
VGPLKFTAACWHAIGGLVAAPGWDVVDEIKARMLGWTTESFADVIAFHHRPTGGSGPWRDMLKRGQGCYVAGYHPLYLAARCLRRLGSRPYLLGALGMGAGFVSGYLGRIPTHRDLALVRYVHQQQWQVVQQECARLGVEPPDHEHAWKPAVLAREEEEYRQAYRLLCPSDFVVQTLLERRHRRHHPEVLPPSLLDSRL